MKCLKCGKEYRWHPYASSITCDDCLTKHAAGRTSFAKQLFCRHDWKIVWRKDLQGGNFCECRKCGKIVE